MNTTQPPNQRRKRQARTKSRTPAAGAKTLETASFYEHILSSIVNGVWVTDKEDVIYYTNTGMETIAGIPKAQIIGSHLFTDFDPATVQQISPFYLKAKESLDPVFYDAVAVVTPDGRLSYQSGWLVPQVSNGKYNGMVCTVDDVTRHVTMEEELSQAKAYFEARVIERTSELQKTVDALASSELRFRSVIETAQDGIVIVDRQGAIMLWNDGAAELFGYTPDEIIGRHISLLMATPRRGDQTKIFSQFMQSTDTQVQKRLFEAVSKRKDGTEFPTEMSYQKFTIDAAPYLTMIFRDITGRKQREAEARQARDHLENIIQSSIDPIVVTDSTGRITKANKAFFDLHQLAPEDMLGSHLADYTFGPPGTYTTTTGDTMSIDEALLTATAEQRSAALIEQGFYHDPLTYHRRRDGKLVPAEATLTLLIDSDGNQNGSVGIYRDITERRKRDAELREAHDHFDNVIQSSLDPIVVTGTDGLITTANKAFFDLHQYAPDEMLGKHITEFAYAPPGSYATTAGDRVTLDDEMLRSEFDRVVNTLFTQGTCHMSTYRMRRDGLLVPVEARMTLLYDNHHEQAGAVGVLRDITEHRRLTNELQAINRELERRVDERTTALTEANRSLEEMNTALKVLLQKREVDRSELEESILTNVNRFIAPHLQKLAAVCPESRQQTMLEIIEASLKNIISPFNKSLRSGAFRLTETELQVAAAIKAGKNSPQIAEDLGSSIGTVEFHRKNIRRKLGLQHTKTNLKTYLKSLA